MASFGGGGPDFSGAALGRNAIGISLNYVPTISILINGCEHFTDRQYIHENMNRYSLSKLFEYLIRLMNKNNGFYVEN